MKRLMDSLEVEMMSIETSRATVSEVWFPLTGPTKTTTHEDFFSNELYSLNPMPLQTLLVWTKKNLYAKEL